MNKEKPLSEKVSELTSNTYVDGIFLKEDVAYAVERLKARLQVDFEQCEIIDEIFGDLK